LNQTSAPSTLPKNEAVFDPKLLHLDNYEIIWFNSDAENPIKFNRLRTISDYVKFFDNINNCREHIERIIAASDQRTIFLVTSGHSAEKLVPTVNRLNQICSIHCLIKDTLENEWILNDPKVSLNTYWEHILHYTVSLR
jgi:hypothetical protein